MNNHHIIRCSTFALAAVCSTIALSVANAQSNSVEQPAKSDRKAPATSPLVLPPITVSVGSDTKAPYQTPGGVSVVDGKIVQEKYGGDANAIVRGMPGTFTRISSSQPGVSVNIRGFESDGRVNTMIDGVPQTFRNTAGHASTGGELLYIDTNLLAGIGAERGAVNGAYGMGSLAGAVNFRTIDFEDVVLEGQDRASRPRPRQALTALALREWSRQARAPTCPAADRRLSSARSAMASMATTSAATAPTTSPTPATSRDPAW
ncbi:TonB-dependent receptor plug domain-containing protein [Aminobacter anthyllidis]|uniref:TonB-dependent receptor plug domain-containing protein n=1 Tax=Aminobacter anthyllidis TaxID=1035067 RepID=UPI0024584E55|nr:TonB-dependent receptor plug domain-containing protein [Aminobacter anthyllidis]MDH4986840.1 TonB-dependent receptor plug domain-containing protein [Aminobacter anthyllidis]